MRSQHRVESLGRFWFFYRFSQFYASFPESMNLDTSVKKIVFFITENYISDPDIKLPLDRSLIEEGILDSYAIIELVSYLEKEFRIVIPDDDITKDNLGSINKMAAYVDRRAAQENRGEK